MLGSGPRMTTGVGSEGGPLALYRCPVSQCGAIHTGASEAGRGSRPRMVSASFSASMMVGALRLPLTIDGMIEASTTRRDRSEEHTSELQSLMRISYAVFCLKQKKKNKNKPNTNKN